MPGFTSGHSPQSTVTRCFNTYKAQVASRNTFYISFQLQLAAMPPTRSASQQRFLTNDSPTRNGRSKPKSNAATIPEHEIIVLSSDNENARPKIGSSSRSKRKPYKRPLPTREVLEISSSSDEGPMLPKALGNINDTSSWQRENSKIKQVRLG